MFVTTSRDLKRGGSPCPFPPSPPHGYGMNVECVLEMIAKARGVFEESRGLQTKVTADVTATTNDTPVATAASAAKAASSNVSDQNSACVLLLRDIFSGKRRRGFLLLLILGAAFRVKKKKKRPGFQRTKRFRRR